MIEKAILAGGCFWGVEDLFRTLPGVTATRVGYTGGQSENPTYKDITTGQTGHAESIEVTFDLAQTSFGEILEFFFKIHDPTTPNQQGNDRGTQYRSAIFYMNDHQKAVAEDLIARLNEAGIWNASICTQITPATTFYEAEDFHQDYLEKNPGGYTCHFIRPNWTLKQKAS